MTFSLETIQKLSPDIAFFRFGKMKSGDYLITNDVGTYAFLSPTEFDDFIL
jgi:hypothetical protein